MNKAQKGYDKESIVVAMRKWFSKKRPGQSGQAPKLSPTRQPKTPGAMDSLSSNEDEKQGHWRTLPAEVALHIFTFLSPEDLCQVDL